MPRYSYGTVPALAWIINHYFYGGVHYAWLADEFYPPPGTNPKSSSPYHIYEDLYLPWLHRDAWDRFIRDMRKSLAMGVSEREQAGRLDNVTAARLRRICRRCSVEFFYPVVYRVDMGAISSERALRRHSALRGSREVLVPDLGEAEFDLLFADNYEDPVFCTLVLDEIAGASATPPVDALASLERR